VDRYYITVAALKGLADMGMIPANKVTQAIQKYEVDADKPNPMTV
jgi:pyruvate dehydrogenase E1 component